MIHPVTKLARVVRARAKHHFRLPIKVSQKGSVLTLSVTDKKSGRKESESFQVDELELEELFHSGDDFYDDADTIINRFMFPVRPLV
jgi:hypothetical protein